MKQEIYKRLLNIALRSFGMGAKFVLILFLAKELTASDVGVFGLFVSGVAFAVLLVGFDYYSFSNRELLSVEEYRWSELIQMQIYAYLPVYILLIPTSILIFYYDFLPWWLFGWFIALLVIEHISQEINRLLNTMQMQLKASAVLFVRSGLWVFVLIPVALIQDSTMSLRFVLLMWFFGSLLSVVLGGYFILSRVAFNQVYRPDVKWIVKGYKVGFVFLIATMALKALSTVDRYWLKEISSTEIVGVYVFYISMILGMSAFLHAAVVVFLSPQIIRACQLEDWPLFYKKMREFKLSIVLFTFVSSALLILFIDRVVLWLDNSLYLDYLGSFYLLVLSGALTALTNYPHTYLYAYKKDLILVLANLSSFVIFVLALLFVSASEAMYKVSLSFLISCAWLFVFKLIFMLLIEKQTKKRLEARWI